MGRELRSIAVMAAILAGCQLLAIAISPEFKAAGLQAFENPESPTNSVMYIVLILAFTAAILLMVRYRRRNLARYVILASVFLTLAFVLLLPFLYLLVFINEGLFNSDLGGNLATILAFAVAAALVYALAKYPEWYVVDSIGIATAVGVTAIMGISFQIFPALLLLAGLAVYDAIAVYRTKHMVALADELTGQRLPVLLVIPKKAGYSFLEQKGLREQIASGEEREAMFIGLGDLIIPGVLSVSAFNYLGSATSTVGSLAPNALVALATVAGALVGFAVLMRFVMTGNPQAGLPLLNGGAILGFLLSYVLVYGNLSFGFL